MSKARFPRAEAYIQAANERREDAVSLLESERWAAAIWVSGVALESLFRGHQRGETHELDTGHDLKRLYRSSRFANFVSESKRYRVAEDVGFVASLWRHRFRYDPEFYVRSVVSRRTRVAFERTAREIVNAASFVISHGVYQWERRT